ncbi:MAG: DNA polymerase III subunit beta [Kiritimatiellae bacterium]|nr:DNA polymerase III subunit beta [Kiritimatiellia bacterium]
MKTTITKAALAEAAQAVRGLVSKDGLSAFSRVRLDAVGPNVSLTGSNGDIQILCRFKGETERDGAVTLPGMLFWRFVGAMPEGKVEIEREPLKTLARLSGSEGVKFRLVAGNPEDLPPMAPPKDEAEVHVPELMLREMLRKTMFAASTDTTRAALCGVNVHWKGDLLEMTATDGRRLAHVEHEVDRGEGFDFTLPLRAVQVLWGLLEADSDETLTVKSDGRSVQIVGDSCLFTSKVSDTVYPGWRKVVPEKCAHEARIGRTRFLDALDRAALAAGEDCSVKMTLKNGCILFDARSDLSAASTGMAACEMDDGLKEEFHFNPRLLKDALEALDEDEFTLHFDNGASPVKLTCSIPWLAVVMPLQKK